MDTTRERALREGLLLERTIRGGTQSSGADDVVMNAVAARAEHAVVLSGGCCRRDQVMMILTK
jgi:hypothetical protein